MTGITQLNFGSDDDGLDDLPLISDVEALAARDIRVLRNRATKEANPVKSKSERQILWMKRQAEKLLSGI